MKNIFLLIAILVFNFSFSQVKKRVFYDENAIEISEEKYIKQIDHSRNLDMCFVSDSLVNCRLVKRENRGKLDSETFANLKKSLSPSQNLDNGLIVIVYYPGKDAMPRNSTWNIFDKDYLKKLGRISVNHHFWIYKSDENLQYLYPELFKWEIDNNRTVEKLFFKIHYPYNSLVVLNQKGDYITYFGESGKQDVWEMAKELKKK